MSDNDPDTTTSILTTALLTNGNTVSLIDTTTTYPYFLHDISFNITSPTGSILSSSEVGQTYYSPDDVGLKASKYGNDFVVYFGDSESSSSTIYDGNGKALAGTSYFNDFSHGISATIDPAGDVTVNYAGASDSGIPILGEASFSESFSPDGQVTSFSQNLLYYFRSFAVTVDYKNGSITHIDTDYGSFSGSQWNLNVSSDGGGPPIDIVTGADMHGHSFYLGTQTFFDQGRDIYEVGLSYSSTNANGDITVNYYNDAGYAETDVHYAIPKNGTTISAMVVEGSTRIIDTYAGSQYDAQLTSETRYAADGSRTYQTIVQNQPYTTQTVSYDASGHETQLERDYASGAPQMIATYNQDGTLNTIHDFDTQGRSIETDKYAADGSRTVTLNTFSSPTSTTPLKVALYTYDASNHLQTLDASYAYAIPYHQITAFQGGETLNAGLNADFDLHGSSAGKTTFEIDALTVNENIQIFNFVANGPDHDVINISKSLASDYQDLQTLVHNGYIDFGNNEAILLNGGNINNIPASDFHFI